jgi:hypothetical protein
MDINTPHVWTSKGHVPEESLVFEPIWEDTPEYVKLRLVYKLDGEIVKESAHVLSKRGISSEAVQQSLV